MSTWDMIQTERASFAETLDALSPEDWNHQSLAADWQVRDVVAHMIATAMLTPPKFFAALAKSGFRFPVMTDRAIEQIKRTNTDQQLAELYRSQIPKRTAPPGPTMGWLGETIVHGEDVTRALGQYGKHDIANVVAVADFYKNSNLLIGSKRRIASVRLAATDADWQYGSGPKVEGPMIALVMAMTGRAVALDDLSGEGVEILRG